MATGRRRRTDTEGRRATLVAAAANVMAADGIAEASTRRIAEAAGVPSGLVHYWFSDKDELLEAVIEQVLTQLDEAVQAAAESGGTLYERLRAAFTSVQEDDRGRQIALYEMTIWALRHENSRGLAQAQYDRYRALARNGLRDWAAASGTAASTDEDTVAQLVAATFDGLTLAWLVDPDRVDPDKVLRLLSHLVEHLEVGGRETDPLDAIERAPTISAALPAPVGPEVGTTTDE